MFACINEWWYRRKNGSERYDMSPFRIRSSMSCALPSIVVLHCSALLVGTSPNSSQSCSEILRVNILYSLRSIPEFILLRNICMNIFSIYKVVLYLISWWQAWYNRRDSAKLFHERESGRTYPQTPFSQCLSQSASWTLRKVVGAVSRSRLSHTPTRCNRRDSAKLFHERESGRTYPQTPFSQCLSQSASWTLRKVVGAVSRSRLSHTPTRCQLVTNIKYGLE